MKKTEVTKILTTHDEYLIGEDIFDVISNLGKQSRSKSATEWLVFNSLLRQNDPTDPLHQYFKRGNIVAIKKSEIVSLFGLGKREVAGFNED
ncbi:hypothetical protein AB0X64_02525 [Limosilactobacillus vaginalis]|uniref:hypothetical protein n=1 Tax=Limosilactobacillus vaginalis TaxID=1633 RepID=UPI003F24DA1F